MPSADRRVCTEKANVMDRRLKRKWVEALMSGQFEQATPAWCWRLSGKHCCLGVLGEVLRAPNMTLLKPIFLDVGLTDDEITEFIVLNDEGVPFEMIAGLIDEAL